MPSIDAVKRFWEANPLFSGESAHPPGSREFFEEHRDVVINDCLAGRFDERVLPSPENCDRVLDLGCGPGFWTIELLRRCSIGDMTAADLTDSAVALTRRRLSAYGLSATVQTENAEKLTFEDGSFGHVNCQGVIHHTPNTPHAVAEIARVLRPGGTAGLSVYYMNWALRNWGCFAWLGNLMRRAGATMPGRGREDVFAETDVKTIVRIYDGIDNPVGVAYSKRQFLEMLAPHLDVVDVFYHFFPARALPFYLPAPIHRMLDRRLPFLIYITGKKR